MKNKIEKELVKCAKNIDKLYSLDKISPILSKEIKNFILCAGKKLRPILFVVGYLGFSKKVARNLYSSALSLELLHDFFLIHDDIIDKSDTRRGKPSMHKKMDKYIAKYKNIKFTGGDLAIVAGDIVYAISIQTFLSVKENMNNKEKALKKIIEGAVLTAAGEFSELLCGAKDVKDVTKEDIYRIYDLKTAFYSFACPLTAGALLAGARQKAAQNLSKYGMVLGRAFQIKDDILGMFGEEKKTGKSSLTDLSESKKTILVWHAYNNSRKLDKRYLRRILSKNNINKTDLLKTRKIIVRSGALDYAMKEISSLLRKADTINKFSNMRPKFKNFLNVYSKKLLSL